MGAKPYSLVISNELGRFTIDEYVGIINLEHVYRAKNIALNK